jgi:penicillin-binding protein 2B
MVWLFRLYFNRFYFKLTIWSNFLKVCENLEKNKNINKGSAVFAVLFLVIFILLLGRFLSIQITGNVEGASLQVLAANQYGKTIHIDGQRGTIYDSKNNVIAKDVNTYKLVANLDKTVSSHIKDPEYTAEKLAAIIGMDESDMLRILTKDKKQVEFGNYGRGINSITQKQIKDLSLPGIDFVTEKGRLYPHGDFASHILGFVQHDEDSNELIGMYGLGKSLNSKLVGKDGFIKTEIDKQKVAILGGNKEVEPPTNGKDIYLTTHSNIQTVLEDAMSSVQKEYQPKKMIGIVADPKTGKILGMSTRPSFNPNIRDISYYYNDAISYSFEPGSTMKVFSLAAFIEEGVFNPDEKYQSGSYSIGKERVRDHNKRGWGSITYLEGVQRSSNVAFAKLTNEKLGTDKLLTYLENFDFDKKTEIDLPGEVNSRINFQYTFDQLSTSFGQASAITPIQQVKAATAIANEGKMMQPYIIERIVDSNTGDIVLENEPTAVGEPISSNTAKKTLEILETVVTSSNGTGEKYKIEGYNIAGKTGTAQIYENGHYLEGDGNYIYSFLGFGPTEDPQLIVYVAVQQPNISEYESGADVVSKIFNPVMKNSLQFLNISPNNNVPNLSIENKKKIGNEITNYVGSTLEESSKKITSIGLTPVVIGNGNKVIKQIPNSGEHILPGERVMLLTNGEPTVPDFYGYSFRDILKFSNLLDIKVETLGNGFVISQNLEIGRTLGKNDVIILELNPPDTKKEKQMNLNGE